MKKTNVIKKVFWGIVFSLCVIPCCAMTSNAAENYTTTENNNMLVTEDADIAAGLPKSPTDLSTYVKWTSTAAGNLSSEPTNVVFLNDRLYRSAAGYLYEIDVNTGETLKEKKLSYSTGYSFFLTTAGDKIILQEGLYVEAFDVDLNQVWISDSMETGNQGLTPLVYDAESNQIFGGTVGVGIDTGCYFCLNATDGGLVWKNEAELVSCGSNSDSTGYYWAGGAVIGNYLVYAGEGGRVYSVNKNTGGLESDTPSINTTPVDVFNICDDASKSVRDSIVYDENTENGVTTGYLYFATTEGTLYKLEYDKLTGQFGNAVTTTVGETTVSTTGFGNSCTATPAIYKDRLYIGDSGCIAVFDISGNKLQNIYRMDTNVGTLRDIRLVADTANNCVYGFTQYYKTPGSILMFRDTVGQTSGEVMDFASLTNSSSMQFSASMPIYGTDGTIYFSNDTGIVTAIASNEAYISALTTNGTLDREFKSGELNYTLVVAPGTEKIKLDMHIAVGAVLQVNGANVTAASGVAATEISIKDVSDKVTMKVTNGVEYREYTLTVREASTEASLNINETKISQSNIYDSAVLSVDNTAKNIYVCSAVDSKWKRLWISLTDKRASYKVYALTDLGTKTLVNSTTKEITSKNTSGERDYIPLYFADDQKTMAVKIQVTAEDGKSVQDYYYLITQEAKDTFLSSSEYFELIKGVVSSEDNKKIIAAYFDNATVSLSAGSYSYTGAEIKPGVTIKNGDYSFVLNTEYTVSYSNNIKPGTATVTIHGIGIYAGLTKTSTFKITAKSISNLKYSKVTAKTYTGKLLKPTVTVKNGSVTLKKDTDYTIKYESNKQIGTAKIVIAGKGNYTGSKKITFQIIPKATKITKVASGKKQLSIKWKKVSGVTGYKIYRSNTKKGTYKLVTTVKGSNKTIYLNKKLKSKKTYYYKVVTYKKVSGKIYASSYSAYKSGKTK